MCQACDEKKRLSREEREAHRKVGVMNTRARYLKRVQLVTIIALFLAPLDLLQMLLVRRHAHHGVKGNTWVTWSVDWFVEGVLDAYRESFRSVLIENNVDAVSISEILAP